MKRISLGIKETFEYTGECPLCHVPQKSVVENSVDILCWNCEYIKKKENIRNVYKYLIGSNIIDIDGSNELTLIRVRDVNKKEYEITGDIDFNDHQCLNVDVVK